MSAPARSIEETAMSTSRVSITWVIGSRWTSTSNIERSMVSGFRPCDIVRFPCGSRSTRSTLKPCSAKATPRFKVVVVFATPPFLFARAITCVSPGTTSLAGRMLGRGRRRARPMWKRISVRLSSFLPPPLEVSSRRSAPARLPRPAPTPPPPARAPVARPAIPRAARPLAAPRSARVEPTPAPLQLPLRPFHDASQEAVTCLCQLRRESASTRDSGDAQHGRRPRPEAEQRVVERHDELGAVSVQERLDERAPDRIACVAAKPFGAELVEQLAPLPGLVTEQDGSPHRGGPRAALAAEQTGQRLADLCGAERLLGEERELPAIECFSELPIGVGQGELRAQVGREAGPDLVEARSLAARLRRRDRKQRRNAHRPEVEALEHDRPGRNRTRGRESQRG